MFKARMAKRVALWTFTLLLALVCLRSGLMKMPGVPGEQFWSRDFTRWGYPGWFQIVVGLVELSSFVLLLVPRLASYGAAAFAVVMVGAIFTHATHDESARLPFNIFLLALSIVVLLARHSALRKRLWKAEATAVDAA